LPIVVDPSHGTGHTYMVPSALASIAAGDGLISKCIMTRPRGQRRYRR
jgi:3-deoxy-7-phosphoheptulonate synthase